MPDVRIAVVSPDGLFREGLLKIIEGEGGLAGAGDDAGSGLPALLRGAPDVLLVDCRVDAVLQLCARLADERGPAIVLLSAPDDDAWGTQALEAGVRGILPHRATVKDLIRAIHAVAAGRIWANREAMAACILARRAAPAPSALDSTAILSAREKDVVRHAAAGRSNKEIAQALGISPATVKAHLARVFQKLGVAGRGELAATYHASAGSRAVLAARRTA